MADFKDNLKKLRERENLTQAALAQKLGISAATVGMYEIGKREPDFETEEKIADFFNVTLDSLRGKRNIYKNDPLSEKIDRLDDIDRIKTEGYIDNLLEASKYKKDASNQVDVS